MPKLLITLVSITQGIITKRKAERVQMKMMSSTDEDDVAH